MSPSFGFSENSGSFSRRFQVGTDHKVLVSNFPFGFTLNYMDERIEIDIYQEGSWNITIDYNKD